jgi:hypothetical protein
MGSIPPPRLNETPSFWRGTSRFLGVFRQYCLHWSDFTLQAVDSTEGDVMSDSVNHVSEELRRGGKKENEKTLVASRAFLLDLICKKPGIADLAGKDLLDMGCGNNFKKGILEGGLPITRYVSIDIHPGLIQFLQSNITDDRITHYTSNTHHAMPNPTGEPLSEQTRLPLDEAGFDIIRWFSAFTHLAPDGYVKILKLLRRAVYSLKHALRLVAGSGWEIGSLNNPKEHIQYYMLCKPI